MSSALKESRVILALEALQKNPKLSLHAAAKIYNVTINTIRNRRDGKPARYDTTPSSRRLTNSEEEAIIQYILELIARSFPPRLYSMEDIANQLLYVRDAPPIGKL